MAIPRITDLGIDEIKTIERLRAPSVIVELRGSAAVAVDSYGRIIAGPDTDHAAVIQAAVNAALRGGTIFIRRGRYYLSRPVTVNTGWAKFAIVGEGPGAWERTFGTVLSPTSSFPTNNYLFDFTFSSYASVRIADIVMYNDKSGINVGGIRFHYSSTRELYGLSLVAERLFLHYLWRGIHYLGSMSPVLRDIHCADYSLTWTGDADLILEKSPSSGLIPKEGRVENWLSHHHGQLANAMRLDCAYFTFYSVGIFGRNDDPNNPADFTDAMIRLGHQTAAVSNKFMHVHAHDVRTGETVLLFDGVDPSAPKCFDNIIEHAFAEPIKIAFRNNAFNNVVRLSPPLRGVTIDDSGAYYDPANGLLNRIEIVSTHQDLAYGFIPPPDATKVMVIDRRFDGLPYSESKSVAIGTGNAYGSATSFRPRSYRITHVGGVKITWSGTFGTGETVTAKITAVYRDGTSYYVEKSATAAGSVWLSSDELATLLQGWPKEIKRIDAQAKTSASSTSVTVSVQVIGRM